MSVRDIVQKTAFVYADYHSIQAFLQGSKIEEFSDRMSADDLGEYLEKLSCIAKTVALTLPTNEAEQAELMAVNAFILQEQAAFDGKSVRLSTFLRRVALGFLLCQILTESSEGLRRVSILRACKRLLVDATAHARQGTLAATIADLQSMSAFSSALRSQYFPSADPNGDIILEIVSLSYELGQGPTLDLRHGQQLGMTTVLSSLMRTRVSRSSWCNILSQRLRDEVEALHLISTADEMLHEDDVDVSVVLMREAADVSERIMPLEAPLPRTITVPPFLYGIVDSAAYVPIYDPKVGRYGCLALTADMGFEVMRRSAMGLQAVFHECSPGHGEQLWLGHMNETELFTFARSPTGLEGWAVYCEQLCALRLNRTGLARHIRLDLIRRIVSCLRGLTGPGTAGIALESWLVDAVRVLTTVDASFVLGRRYTNPLIHLSYIIGLVETEAAMATVRNEFPHESERDLLRRFAGVGPLAPSDIASILTDKAKPKVAASAS